MAKRKKRTKRQVQQGIPAPAVERPVMKEHRNSAWLPLLLIVIFLQPIVYFYHNSLSPTPFSQMLPIVRQSLSVVSALLLLPNAYVAIKVISLEKTKQSHLIKKYDRISFLIAATNLGLIIFPFLYILGLNIIIEDLINNYIPAISKGSAQIYSAIINYVIANAASTVTTIILGLITNYIYDALKSRFFALKQRAKSRQVK